MVKEMNSDWIDFELPDELIAQTPLEDRASSRLLMLEPKTGEIRHSLFRTCPNLFQEGDVLVVNETRVTAMRLIGKRDSTGQGKVELLLLEQMPSNCFKCLANPAKKLKINQGILFENGLYAEVIAEHENGMRTVQFCVNKNTNIAIRSENNPTDPEILNRLQEIAISPLPPYIKEPLKNRERYQTIYAESQITKNGSAAAPTAGLHFTSEILNQIEMKGVTIVKVNLKIGLDTFRPISAEKIENHLMHGEVCSISEETCEQINNRKGRLIAVGTTTVRTLETFVRESKNSDGKLKSGSITSKLFLKPGDKLQIVGGMFTNFHMPRTTMLLMIAAFASKPFIENAYREAIEEKYRFLSFGDSMYIGSFPPTY